MSASPPFLDSNVIRAGCAEVGLCALAEATLLALASRIRSSPELTRLTATGHHAVYDTDRDFADALSQADAALGGEADLLHALYVLDSLRLVRERHGARGVAADITRAVNQRHGMAWLRGALDASGVPRLADWLPIWFRLVGSGELYRLGRLELVIERWEYPFRAYVHAHTGQALVLADPGPANERVGEGEPSSRRCSLEIESEGDVIGTPISPRGHALAGRVRLAASEWRLALGQGDWVLDIHVPAEGALTLEALRNAFERAESFFEQYYPRQPFVAYACDSWLFSSQLEGFLNEPSNILAWQRQGYLLPGERGEGSFLKFTFGSPDVNPATAPRDTRLRRAVLDHLAQGKRLHDGVFLLLRRDLERFGSTPYREASEQVIARAKLG